MPNLLRVVIAGAFCFLCQACGGGGGSGGGTSVAAPPPRISELAYQFALIADIAMPANPCMAPLFAPADLGSPIYATTVDLASHQNDTGFIGDEAPMAAYPRHLTDGGPTLVLDSGAQLTDDIRLLIGTDAAGQYVSVQIKGQPLIGADSLSHESEIVQFTQSVDPIETQASVAHVDSMQPIPMWELDDHLGGNRVAVIGNFCLGDMTITPSALVGATP